MKKFGIILLVVFSLIVGIAIGQNNQVAVNISAPDPLTVVANESLHSGTPSIVNAFTPVPTRKATSTPTAIPTPTAKATPTVRPTPIASPTPDPTPTYFSLYSGDSGEAVVALQERLADLGYVVGKADGDYGAKTISAVKMVQVLAGLEVTGIADAETQEMLWSWDAPTAQPRPTKIEPTPTPEPEYDESSDDACDYIANKNTKVFHYPDCSSVDQMKGKNKWYFNGDRETLIKKGYRPCKRCDP